MIEMIECERLACKCLESSEKRGESPVFKSRNVANDEAEIKVCGRSFQ